MMGDGRLVLWNEMCTMACRPLTIRSPSRPLICRPRLEDGGPGLGLIFGFGFGKVVDDEAAAYPSWCQVNCAEERCRGRGFALLPIGECVYCHTGPAVGIHELGDSMGKIETVLKSEIGRLARRETKALITKHVDELRRLRRRVASLERELKTVKAARAQEQAKRKVTTAVATAAGEEGTTIRLSPRLIRSLRSRLGISQAELAKLVGVSTVAVGNWELGKSKPRDESKARIAAMRSLGRREVRRLLAESA